MLGEGKGKENKAVGAPGFRELTFSAAVRKVRWDLIYVLSSGLHSQKLRFTLLSHPIWSSFKWKHILIP